MTDWEKAVVMAYTGVCTFDGEKIRLFHRYIEQQVGRRIFTHELASGVVEQEIKDATRADFLSICADTVPDDVLHSYGPMQKPLTLEEVKALEKPWPLWCEYKDPRANSGECFPEIVDKVDEKFIDYGQGVIEIEHYQSIFRYWQTKPTEAERAAAKWGDEE